MERCAFDLGEKCNAMAEKNCNGCKFRKTEQELKEGREKAVTRLMTLDRTFLNGVKRKYYYGNRNLSNDCKIKA